MKHVLKINPPYFAAVAEFRKSFEIRQNDRGFQAGDEVLIREWDENMPRPVDWLTMPDQRWKFTGREILVSIDYVTGFEQKPNWVVFGFHHVNP